LKIVLLANGAIDLGLLGHLNDCLRQFSVPRSFILVSSEVVGTSWFKKVCLSSCYMWILVLSGVKQSDTTFYVLLLI
jgi:hypothetical protein